jgi:hypothetical protein
MGYSQLKKFFDYGGEGEKKYSYSFAKVLIQKWLSFWGNQSDFSRNLGETV